VDGLKHQKERRSMDHFSGLDVSVEKTSVCIVDETGKIVPEVKVAREIGSVVGGAEEPRWDPGIVAPLCTCCYWVH